VAHRVLFIDASYPAFLATVYGPDETLSLRSYDEQLAAIDAGLFGEAQFQVHALRSLGHDASRVIVNAAPLQAAWRREKSRTRADRIEWRLRRNLVPWPSRRLDPWPTMFAQVEAIRPDIIYVEIVDSMPPSVVERLTRRAFVVGQLATAIPRQIELARYNLIISSIPTIVAQAAASGTTSAYLPLAFEPRLAEEIKPVERTVPASFVGSFSDRYADRVDILEAVAERAPLNVWTSDTAQLPEMSILRGRIRGAAFGRQMYETMNQSLVTLNTHGIVSGNAANNLRLFEATGMGALLITDRRNNLGDLFEPGTEVVTYSHPEEAAEATAYYVEHPKEAAQIAEAGRQRTLREHTWADRMARTIEFIDRVSS